VIKFRAAGDAALLLDIGEGSPELQPAHIAAAISAANVPGIVDVVPAAQTVLVIFDPAISADPHQLANHLRALIPVADSPQLATPAVTEVARASATIDVIYDGPDLADVAKLTGLSVDEVVAAHQATTYRVGWLGFSPGFGYLTGLDDALAAVPRLATPRVSVAAGAVAIAGGLAAVYPAESPGGWRLLGRTNAVMWNPDRDPPGLLSPGMQVRFRAVAQLSDDALGAVEASSVGIGFNADAPRAAAATEATVRAQTESAGAQGRPPSPHQAVLEINQPGPLATIQDLGRPGLAHLGVPHSGAADPASLRHANDLVGNDHDAAGLEVTLGRLEMRCDTSVTVAVTGAPAPLRLTGQDGEISHPPPAETAFSMPAGATLKLGAPRSGLRSYVAIAGGISARPALGSRSADLLSGLGPRPLRPGDRLLIGRPRSRQTQPLARQPRPVGLCSTTTSDPVVLRAIAGPRDDWFADSALTALANDGFTVSAQSNRTGLRLTGPPLRRGPAHTGELPSEGLATGSLQVTHDGQLILMLADHPTTGGYPVIAVVVSADVGVAAQLRPGQRIRFSVQRPRFEPAAATWVSASQRAQRPSASQQAPGTRL
jgi:KipI family sensor histidine kinase inhibitor